MTPSSIQLELPKEHALNKLYYLRVEQSGGLPLPHLLLEGREDLSQEEIKRELNRLENMVTSASDARLEQISHPAASASGMPPLEVNALSSETDDSREEALKTDAPAEEGKIREEENHVFTDINSDHPEDADPLTADLDALPLVFIAADHLAAWIMVLPPVGKGKELNMKILDHALESEGVTFGIDEDLLQRLPQEKERYFNLFLIAKGNHAADGKDGYIVDYFSRSMEKKFTVDEHDRVDYTSLNLVQNVSKGEAICQAVPPTQGVPGRTVYDQEIPAKDGKPVQLPKGRNTEISEDGSQLLAMQDGHVQFSGRSFQVRSVLEIPGNVDYSTGNINYVGDVHIRGNVCSGFSVRAMGNVTVDGVVEAGTIEAGGDLIVARGVVGNSQAVVRAHHSIYAKYLENSVAHARENLHADCIVNSDVYSDGEIQVNTGRGIIIGGKVRAARTVCAKVIGSKTEAATAISLGAQPCANFERELLELNIEKLMKELEQVERQPDSPARTKRLGKIRLDTSVERMKLNQLDKELAAQQDEDEKPESWRMECDIAYPGIVLTMGNVTMNLTDETWKCNAKLVDGEIRLS